MGGVRAGWDTVEEDNAPEERIAICKLKSNESRGRVYRLHSHLHDVTDCLVMLCSRCRFKKRYRVDSAIESET